MFSSWNNKSMSGSLPLRKTYDCLGDSQGTILQIAESMEPLLLSQVL